MPLDCQTLAKTPKNLYADCIAPSASKPAPRKKQILTGRKIPTEEKKKNPRWKTDDYTHSPKYISAQDQKEEEERCRRLEYLNDKYGLDYYSSLELDSKSEHEYATLV